MSRGRREGPLVNTQKLKKKIKIGEKAKRDDNSQPKTSCQADTRERLKLLDLIQEGTLGLQGP